MTPPFPDDETQPMTQPVIVRGRMLSHYRLQDVLGRGGMGVVWKAEDVLLKRPVAIKVLPPTIDKTSEAAARFQIEAQAAASLDHPAICTIYEIDYVDGTWFIAMAFIDGQTIAQRLRKGPLPYTEALNVVAAAAAGLEAAHARGIVHRDIKSSNIIIASSGQAKILDFGVARVAGQPHLTDFGKVLGTPLYMSPEQLQGIELDTRTDLWSLGVVLYEALSGKIPFQAESREALHRSILHDTPIPIRRIVANIPSAVDQILSRALARNVGDRYQTASELMEDLLPLLGERPSRISTASDTSAPSTRRTGSDSVVAIQGVVVLPFENVPADPAQEYFSDGLTDELIHSLSQTSGLRVVSRTSSFALKGKVKDLREVATLLRVDTALVGTVRRAGSRMRILVQLVRISDDSQIWSHRFDVEMQDIFEVQEQIARSVADSLKLTLSGGSQAAGRYAANFKAYDLYLQGQYHIDQLNPVSVRKALDFFEQALQADPEYAPAHVGIARYYTRLAYYNAVAPLDALPKALAAASRALEIDNGLAETHAILGEILLPLQWDWSGAEREFLQAIRLAPNDSNLRQPYALLLIRQGRFDEAYRHLMAGLKIDPLSKVINTDLAYLYYYAREFEQALAASAKILDLDPAFLLARACQALSYAALGRLEEAVKAHETTMELTGGEPIAASFLANGYARAGRQEDARRVLNSLLEQARSRYVSPGFIAVAYTGLGDHDNAFHWLRQGIQAHDIMATFTGILPTLDPLREDPRYPELLRMAGLSPSMHPSRLHLRATDSGSL